MERVDHSRSIARNTGLQSGAHVLGLVLSVGSAAIITRYLGVRAFGTLSLITVLLTLPLTVLNGSLDTLAVRHLSVENDDDGHFFRNVLALKVAIAVAFASVAVVISWLTPLPFALRLAVAAFGVAIVASAVQGTLIAVEQVRLRFQLPVLVDVGTKLFVLAGLLLLATLPHPLDPAKRVALCVCVTAAAALVWLTYSIVRRRRSVTLRLGRDRSAWARLGRAAGPLALINLLGLVNYRLDVVVLGALAGAHSVGIYAVATRFIDAALPLAGFFVAASFPVLAMTAANAAASRQGQVQRGAEFLLLASVPITLGGWIFAPELVHLIAGDRYRAAVLPLRLLLISLPFSYVSTFLLYLVIAADRQRRVLPLLWREHRAQPHPLRRARAVLLVQRACRRNARERGCRNRCADGDRAPDPRRSHRASPADEDSGGRGRDGSGRAPAAADRHDRRDRRLGSRLRRRGLCPSRSSTARSAAARGENDVNPAVGVVIVNANAGRYLELALESLEGQTVPPHRVVVVDNASIDGSLDGLADRFPAVELVQLDDNVGFAAANNLAVGLCTDCEFIAFLNPDAFPEPHWLEALLAAADEHPECGFFGSRLVLDADDGTLDGTGDSYHVSGLAWRRDQGEPTSIERPAGETFSACAAAALYRRAALVDVGGFDESFFCYYEDTDLAFRMRLAGHGCRYVPEAVARHVGSATTGLLSDFTIYHSSRNTVWTFVKNMPGLLFWLYLPQHLLVNAMTTFVYAIHGQGRAALRGKRDALRALPRVLGERRQIQAARVASTADLRSAMARGGSAYAFSFRSRFRRRRPRVLEPQSGPVSTPDRVAAAGATPFRGMLSAEPGADPPCMAPSSSDACLVGTPHPHHGRCGIRRGKPRRRARRTPSRLGDRRTRQPPSAWL